MIKKLSFLISISIIILFILSSCSLQKRQYARGYYIDWKNSKHTKPETVKTFNETKTEKIILSKKSDLLSNLETNKTILASNDIDPVTILPIKKIKFIANKTISSKNNFKSHKLNPIASYKSKKPDEGKKKVSIIAILLIAIGLASLIFIFIYLMANLTLTGFLLFSTVVVAAILFLIVGFIILSKE